MGLTWVSYEVIWGQMGSYGCQMGSNLVVSELYPGSWAHVGPYGPGPTQAFYLFLYVFICFYIFSYDLI